MGKIVKLGTLKGNDMLLNSKNKLNKSMPEVSRGCGAHKSKKQYTRKAKHKLDKNQNE